MSTTKSSPRLVYVKDADLELWGCRPFETVDILDLHDRHVGRFDGLVVDRPARQPLFIVVRRASANGAKWFRLVAFRCPVWLRPLAKAGTAS